jgi:predicted nucleic acid-binding protein
VILYLDTSSLVKLYVDEVGSGDVQRLVELAEIVTTSAVAYPEARAAFARRRRERSLTPAAFRRAKGAFEVDWPRVLSLNVSGPLARSAGDLAERHRLRGFDALHLASYLLRGRRPRARRPKGRASDPAPREVAFLEGEVGDEGPTRSRPSCLRHYLRSLGLERVER